MVNLVCIMGVNKVIEVGIYIGYSFLVVVLVFFEKGILVVCDVFEEWILVVKRFWEEVGVVYKI